MDSALMFSITITIVAIIGGIVALKYADYEQRKRHGGV